MNNRELLEQAAKAAGFEDHWYYGGPIEGIWSDLLDAYWNPLTDDGDALWLAVKLGLCVHVNDIAGQTRAISRALRSPIAEELFEGDPYAATRRAIVRAAAEIGKEMK